MPKTRNATKLKKAAQATARRGDSTRVETTVAMELAASWKPLTKSKASASPTTTMTAASSMRSGRQACLRTIDSTTFETSSSVLSAASIASTTSFQREHVEGVELAGEQAGERPPEDARRPRSRARRWRRGRGCTPFIDSSRAISSTASSAMRTSRSACSFSSGTWRRSSVAEPELVDDVEHVVDDVVELLGERVDVLPVERGDERGVEPLEDRRG